jgi:hypothetical protein
VSRRHRRAIPRDLHDNIDTDDGGNILKRIGNWLRGSSGNATTVVATTVIAVATVTYTALTLLQLNEIHKGNIAGRRAFVYFDKPIVQNVEKAPAAHPEVGRGIVLFNVPGPAEPLFEVTFVLVT